LSPLQNLFTSGGLGLFTHDFFLVVVDEGKTWINYYLIEIESE
jgi:hypothetical protein